MLLSETLPTDKLMQDGWTVPMKGKEPERKKDRQRSTVTKYQQKLRLSKVSLQVDVVSKSLLTGLVSH